MSKQRKQRLADLVQLIQRRVESSEPLVADLHQQMEDSLAKKVPPVDYVRQLAHTCFLMHRFDASEQGRLSNPGRFRTWLLHQNGLDWGALLQVFATLSPWMKTTEVGQGENGEWDEYGPFLGIHEPGRRTRRGVYYTPPPVARYIIGRVNQFLKEEWDRPNGLGWLAAEDCPFVLRDPAVGSGIFLTAAIERLWECYEGSSPKGSAAARRSKRPDWSCWLRRPLTRLQGRDVLLPAVALAHLRIALQLESTGYDLAQIVPLGIALGDSLREPSAGDTANLIVGNPPFSGISQNRSAWIEALMRDPASGYYSVNGRKLGEKKLWISDDYVKFFRAAQNAVEGAGEGIVAFVTNHAMLDNATFRGMRWSLQQTFSRQTVLDLHGNRKRDERTPDGALDENVFEIESGIAIVLLRRGGKCPRTAEYGELQGTRAEKLAALERSATQPVGVRWTRLANGPPHYLMSPSGSSEKFQAGVPLPEIFPVNTTAPVTARDRVVVAHTAAELLETIGQFRDPAIPDTEIRDRFFRRNGHALQREGRRTSEYEKGDTRGWRLPEARQRIGDDPSWRDRVRGCLYRPFDMRAVYWTTGMVDWPRTSVTRHSVEGGNLVLIARRLSPPNARGVYLWACCGLTLDGVIRSDNRGSESLFPVRLMGDSEPKANIAPAWIGRLQSATGLDFVAAPQGDLFTGFGAEDVAAYVYAQLQSPAYLGAFTEDMRHEFPRVFPPADLRSFRALCESGRLLLALHIPELWTTPVAPEPRGATEFLLRAPFPRWSRGELDLGGAKIEGVSEEVWEFRVGTHQVCRKWWRDRRGRLVQDRDLGFFRKVLASIQETIRHRAVIAGSVSPSGLWRVECQDSTGSAPVASQPIRQDAR